MVAIRICPEGNIIPTDLYKYSMPDAAPPIHAVATDKGPSIDGGKFKFRKTDGRRIGIRFPVFILTYAYSSACIWRGLVRRRCSAGPVLPLWVLYSANCSFISADGKQEFVCNIFSSGTVSY